jgi:hypothetical protein
MPMVMEVFVYEPVQEPVPFSRQAQKMEVATAFSSAVLPVASFKFSFKTFR